MNKLLLSILLSCSFSVVASDVDTQPESIEISRAVTACQDLQKQLEKLTKEMPAILNIQALRTSYVQEAAICLPNFSTANLWNFMSGQGDTFTVTGKNGQVFTLSADKSALHQQLPARHRLPVPLANFKELKYNGEEVNLSYEYYISLSLISRGSHSINLNLVLPEDDFNNHVKSSLISVIQFLFKAAKKVILINNFVAKDNYERWKILSAQIKSTKNDLLKACEDKKFDEISQELAEKHALLVNTIPQLLENLKAPASRQPFSSAVQEEKKGETIESDLTPPVAPPVAPPAASLKENSSANRSDLLKDIRAGTRLKKAETVAKSSADKNSPLGILFEAFANRRAAIAPVVEEEVEGTSAASEWDEE